MPLRPVAVGRSSRLVLVPADPLPRIVHVGAASSIAPTELLAAIGTHGVTDGHGPTGRSIPLLPVPELGWPGRAALRGHRLDDCRTGWTSAWRTEAITAGSDSLAVEARADGLRLRTEIEAAPGGALRLRHTLTNDADTAFALDRLDVVVPLSDTAAEVLDLTGRWGREREPQRRPIGDGVWLRESRGGRPGHDAATQLVAGTTGFGFAAGSVWAAHVAWSGNSALFAERQPSGLVTLGGGELLLPGEIVLGRGESYATPWLVFAASDEGLDGLAAQLHGYARALPAHPPLPRPVTCNVWEAVYFDHDLARLHEIADLAAAVGVERFVLDDGWFGGRRDDRAGLGDWSVSPDVWPDGLDPLIEHVTARGMHFGLWFEPEMINPDSDLYRAHPDWVLGAADQALQRNQLVLDLSRAEVRDHLFDAIDAVLSEHDIRYVKWDHNRDLYDASSAARGGAAAAHAHTEGFYELLDRLRAAHPAVEWESCASGGGRVDLGVLERVQRVWTSDMTDALSRQVIQRWTAQLLPPEYIGAHVSAPVNHQTGRALDLDLRAATAFFGDFGIEWDLSSATPPEREQLARWIASYRARRSLLHAGVVTRVDTVEAAILQHAVVAVDGSAAVAAYVQLDEFVRDPLPFRVRGLDPGRRYRASVVDPLEAGSWRGEGLVLSGAALAAVGLPAPSRRPSSSWVVDLRAVDGDEF
ncbi:MAG TPA: alpha-galactosidase [Jatrophihabitans sp.]|jgi:alpha-galactosidase|uniref:alpha-galactosidase n=1 Tax=Jatrophihabitans sp. TaxID=1932789 RepID=UPI002E09E080|nr:alpha-galactosidase [Jatrophihabitans sp.]